MWSDPIRRLALFVLALGGLAACGFEPAYAPGGAATELRGQILPDAPDSAIEFAFASRLEDRLGRAEVGAFTLGYEIDTLVDGLAITPDQETLRFNLVGRADFTVRNMSDGAVLTSGAVENFVSYSAIGTTVATRASETDAQERLAVILADQIVSRLVATAASWVPPAGVVPPAGAVPPAGTGTLPPARP
ncbi:MAG: LPS assembly lipoprotein LptE [Pseudomonadota bacterium]